MLINNRYQVIHELGEGGFGQAYLAIDQQMPSQRKCAIKQLKPINDSSQVYQLVQARFQREAAILERLGEDHKQIPRLYAYFSENRQFYLVQEWIDGTTLASLMAKQGPQSEAAIRSLLTALLPVLDFIHSQGIIHRDIKPDNIILRKGSHQPVLIDFGAVRETMATVMESQNSPKSSMVIGTPGFMPPEQAAGRPIPSSDLYSLGLVAIFLLTGHQPQSFETDVRTGEIMWQARAQSASPGFVAVLDRAVKSHPRDRYSSAQAMLTELLALPEAESDTGTIPAQPASSTYHSGYVTDAPVPAAPLATDSTLKTVAVAPARPATAYSESSPHGTENSSINNANNRGNNPPKETPKETFSHNTYHPPSDTRVQNNQTQSISSDRPLKRWSPLLIALASAAVTGSALAGGFLITRTTNDLPSQNSAAAPESGSAQTLRNAAEDEQQNSEASDSATTDSATTDNANDESIPSSAEETTEENTSTGSELTQPGGQQVTLGSSSGTIPVYDTPSFAASSSQSGASGDLVTILDQAPGDDGSGWYYVRFGSGVQGWVAQAYADSSSYSSATELEPAVEPVTEPDANSTTDTTTAPITPEPEATEPTTDSVETNPTETDSTADPKNTPVPAPEPPTGTEP